MKIRLFETTACVIAVAVSSAICNAQTPSSGAQPPQPPLQAYAPIVPTQRPPIVSPSPYAASAQQGMPPSAPVFAQPPIPQSPVPQQPVLAQAPQAFGDPRYGVVQAGGSAALQVQTGATVPTAFGQALPAEANSAANMEAMQQRLQAAEDEIREMRSIRQRVQDLGDAVRFQGDASAFKPFKEAAEQRLDNVEKQLASPTSKSFPMAKLSGFFQQDTAYFSQDATSTAQFGELLPGADFRRFRLMGIGSVTENVNYFMEVDFAATGRPSFLDVWGELETDRDIVGSIRVGQFRQPFSMDALTSVRQLTFLERSLPFNAFVPFRRIGAMAYNNSDDMMWTWAGSVARAQADQYAADLSVAQGYLISGRATHLLYYDEPAEGRYLVHVGANYDFSSPGHTYPYSFRSQPGVLLNVQPNPGVVRGGGLPVQSPGTTFGTPFFANTGGLNLNDFNLYGLELATVYGPWHTQSEIMAVSMNQVGGPWITLPGAYIETGYYLTGESRQYQRTAGVFDRTRPFEDFFLLKRGQGHGWGAWQLAFRWDWIDLTNSALRSAVSLPTVNAAGLPTGQKVDFLGGPGTGSGGSQTDLTVGLNWYLNPYTKFQFNYVHVFYKSPDFALSNTDVYATRFQVDF